MYNLIQILGISQPATLINVVTNGAGNEVILISIRTIDQKFGHSITCRSVFDVLAQAPPTVVIHLFEILLRTFKQRNILFHPGRCFRVRNSLSDVFIFHVIEVISIMTESSVLQESSCCIHIGRRGFEVGHTESTQSILRTGIGQVVSLIGRCFRCRKLSQLTRTESNSLNSSNRSIEHTCTRLLSVNKYLNASVSHRQ